MFRFIATLLMCFGYTCWATAQTPAPEALIGNWLVVVDGDSRTRAMQITKIEPSTDGAFKVSAAYGWENSKLADVAAVVTPVPNGYLLKLITPAKSRLELMLKSPNSLEGKFIPTDGVEKIVKVTKNEDANQSLGQSKPSINSSVKRQVHLVYLGGDDCPPCVAWRRFELPKLQETEAFKASKFSHVKKTIGSPIPSSFFLPEEVKPLKPILEEANGGFSGSPQFAVIVDGKIYDYYWGTWDAQTTEKMLISALTGSKYPHASRCLKYVESNRICKQSIKTQ